MNDYSEFKTETQSENILKKLSNLARKTKETELEIEELTESLAAAKQKFKFLVEDAIPSVMDEADQEYIRTFDGIEISVSDEVFASIPKPLKDKAYKWLEENNQGGLIKRKFVVEFSKNDKEWADEFEDRLRGDNHKPKFSKDMSVHWQTLNSFVKEQLKEGKNLPEDLFGIYQRRTAKVK